MISKCSYNLFYDSPAYLKILIWIFWEKDDSRLGDKSLKDVLAPSYFRSLFCSFLLQTQQRLRASTVLGRRPLFPSVKNLADNVSLTFSHTLSLKERN
jgi:hypothetical protein